MCDEPSTTHDGPVTCHVVSIRSAQPADAARLSALALRSKAHWGNDAEFTAACVPVLAVAPERIGAPGEHVVVAEDADGGVAGFAALHADVLDSRAAELTDLFVEPFYLHQGARRVGAAPFTAIPGRTIPLLRYEIRPRREADREDATPRQGLCLGVASLLT